MQRYKYLWFCWIFIIIYEYSWGTSYLTLLQHLTVLPGDGVDLKLCWLGLLFQLMVESFKMFILQSNKSNSNLQSKSQINKLVIMTRLWPFLSLKSKTPQIAYFQRRRLFFILSSFVIHVQDILSISFYDVPISIKDWKFLYFYGFFSLYTITYKLPI